VAYCAGVITMTVEQGVPTGRQTLAILILTGLGIACIGRRPHRLLLMLRDWLPFTAVLLAYDRTRALADTTGLPLHEGDIASAERWLFAGTLPTVWLQDHLEDAVEVHWYDALCTLVYVTHFLVTPILAAVLWVRAHPQFVAWIVRVIALSVAGLATYILFPEAPPWMAARDGVIGTPIARTSSRGWIWFHLRQLHDTLRIAEVGSNQVAAMPSLHVGFATLVALFLGRRITSRWRWLLTLYPLAMTFALVYTGEHYVIDALAGAVYALAVDRLVALWEHRRARSRAPALEPVP
jgi:hypothetical protein